MHVYIIYSVLSHDQMTSWSCTTLSTIVGDTILRFLKSLYLAYLILLCILFCMCVGYSVCRHSAVVALLTVCKSLRIATQLSGHSLPVHALGLCLCI